MTRSTMKWLAPYLLALLALASPTRRAEAQVIQGFNGIKIGPDDLEVTTKININSAQCRQEFVFDLNNVQPIAPFIEVWVTSTPNADCNLGTARSSALSGQQTQCWKAAELPNVVGKFKFPVPGNAIFDQDRAGDGCDQNLTNQPFWVHFVPLQTPKDKS